MGGWGISTDLDTITVPSLLLPHHFWPCSRCATGNRTTQLSGRRFGQSGIKCRALFSHSAPGVGTPGDRHCAFSHTSLGGDAVILSFWKKKWVARVRDGGDCKMGKTDGMNEGQGAGVGKVERGWRREVASNAGAVETAPGLVYQMYKWFNTVEFRVLTLCGCATVMAAGYRAQGEGGSKETYFYSCFQATVHVTGKV